MPSSTAIPKHILSKSTFMRGCQCGKSLWLYKHRRDLMDEVTDAQSAIFIAGTDIGKLAREIYPGGVDATPPDAYQYQQAVADTAAFIASGEKIIYEAAFQFDGIMVALDILVQQNDRWYAHEVKNSTKVKAPFIQDAAIQYYAITNSGLPLEDISIVHLNNGYVKAGNLDVQQLFTKTSVKSEVKELQLFIHGKAAELKAIASLKEMPSILHGDHCSKPYTCNFYGYCWKDVVDDPAAVRPENIDKDEIKSFLTQFTYPLYFMDFETYILAVPEYDGHWPYRQVPFQYSLHIQNEPDGALEHKYFLAENNGDPCFEFVQKLVNDLDRKGSVIVYNQAFENTRLRELKEDYPEFAHAIEKVQARIIDLMVPFRKKHIYLPAMGKSYSIKNVLPALVPELNYTSLVIGNGADASNAFYNLKHETDAIKIIETRQALLDYCGMDTLAMVRILEKMREIV